MLSWTFVYKEYFYHLRQLCDGMLPLTMIKEKDKQQPPPNELLEMLGPPYSSDWTVHKGQFGSFVLRYPFIEGFSHRTTVADFDAD